jgi:FlaA1/EpsC-like NDP-sugar epimerase
MLYSLAVSLTRCQKRAILLGVDIIVIGLAYCIARLVIHGPTQAIPMTGDGLIASGVLVTLGTAVILLQGLHRIKLNAYEMQGMLETTGVAATLALAGVVCGMLLDSLRAPLQVAIFTAVLFVLLSVSARLVLRAGLLQIYRRGHPRVPIVIYGAGRTGQQLASALFTDTEVKPVAFIDDDRRLQGLAIVGLRVHAPADLDHLIGRHGVKRIVLSMPSARPAVQQAIAQRMRDTGCEVHVLPSFGDLVANTSRGLADTRPIDMQKLMARDVMDVELPGVSDTYRARRVLVTGAGGSIGSELCRQLMSCRPEKLILMDHSELSLFNAERELRDLAPDLEVVCVLGSICDAPLVRAVMTDHAIEIVLHAAAYKHVAMVENNALEGMRNNVLGTKTLADAARNAGVERFILVSTDKAVRPSSVMGASKRLAELVIQDMATRSTTTCFSMVRFGNVLGSSGSVIPLFADQIKHGGPVTLTHAGVTRYFMTISEAVRLVLLTGSFAQGGDVFVLDMGKPVPIRDLALRMIEQAGHTLRDAKTPNGDIEIRITGLRPGEKLHEELLIGSDMLTTPHPKILRAQESHLSEIETATALNALRQAIETRDTDLLDITLARWIEGEDTAAPVTVNE